MAAIHALETGPNGTRIVIHQPTPTGNNSVPAGVSWVAAGLASGDLKASVLSVGPGAGQIGAAEAAAIAAGTTMEVQAFLHVDPNWTAAQRTAALAATVTAALRDLQATLALKLKYLGYTQ